MHQRHIFSSNTSFANVDCLVHVSVSGKPWCPVEWICLERQEWWCQGTLQRRYGLDPLWGLAPHSHSLCCPEAGHRYRWESCRCLGAIWKCYVLFGSFCLYSLSWIEECGTINLSSLPSGQLLIWVDGLEFYCFLLKLKGIVTGGFPNDPGIPSHQWTFRWQVAACSKYISWVSHTQQKIWLLQRQGNIVDRSE